VNRHPSTPTSASIVEDSEGKSEELAMNNLVPSTVATAPYTRACTLAPSEFKIQSTGVGPVVSSLIRDKKFSSERVFLAMVHQVGLLTAVFWAKHAGWEYKTSLAELHRLGFA
jgi:hypothetical protein